MGRVLVAVVGEGGEDHAVLAGDAGEAGPEVEADAVLGVQVGEDLTDLGAEDRVQRGRLGLDDGDLGAVLAGRRGDLQADPARARDHDVAVVPAEGGEDALEALRVGEAAQVVHAGELGARDVHAARLRAGDQEQLVVVDDRAVAQPDVLHGRVDRDDGLAEVQLDVVLCVPGRFVDEDAVPFLLALEIALGQGWAFVRMISSSPMRITLPLKPSERSVSAAFAPASPPPTMTNV